MELEVNSPASVGETTISPLTIDDLPECDILEDKIREIPGQPISSWKIPGITAIPAGRYEITITMSPKFKKMLMLLNDVPGYEGVRIHGGNTAENTDGCLITGNKVNNSTVENSQNCLKKLQAKVQAALDMKQKVFITINRPGIPAQILA